MEPLYPYFSASSDDDDVTSITISRFAGGDVHRIMSRMHNPSAVVDIETEDYPWQSDCRMCSNCKFDLIECLHSETQIGSVRITSSSSEFFGKLCSGASGMGFWILPCCYKRKFLRRSIPTASNVMCVDANIDGLLSPHCNTRSVRSTTPSESSTSTTWIHCHMSMKCTTLACSHKCTWQYHLGKWCVCILWKKIHRSNWDVRVPPNFQGHFRTTR